MLHHRWLAGADQGEGVSRRPRGEAHALPCGAQVHRRADQVPAGAADGAAASRLAVCAMPPAAYQARYCPARSCLHKQSSECCRSHRCHSTGWHARARHLFCENRRSGSGGVRLPHASARRLQRSAVLGLGPKALRSPRLSSALAVRVSERCGPTTPKQWPPALPHKRTHVRNRTLPARMAAPMLAPR